MYPAAAIRAPFLCNARVGALGLRLLHNGVKGAGGQMAPKLTALNRGRTYDDVCPPFRRLNWRQRRGMSGARAHNAASQETGGQQQGKAQEQQQGRGMVQQKQVNGRGLTRQPLGGGGFLSPALDDLWDPFFARGSLSPARSISRMLDTMDRLFEDFSFTTMPRGVGTAERSILRTPFEMQENDDAYHLRVDLPGLSKDEVKLHVEDGNILCIKGEHSEEKKQDQRFARSFGTYQTKLVLADDADATKIDAELKDGVLLVTVPKRPELKENKVIDIAIK